jgi:hypothetical protein
VGRALPPGVANAARRGDADGFVKAVQEAPASVPLRALQEASEVVVPLAAGSLTAWTQLSRLINTQPYLTCPAGHVARPKPGALPPTTNGCGPNGAALPKGIVLPGFTACCNAHDTGYARCGSSQRQADDALYLCLRAACNSLGNTDPRRVTCPTSAYAYFAAVTNFGGAAYRSGQEQCECVPA